MGVGMCMIGCGCLHEWVCGYIYELMCGCILVCVRLYGCKWACICVDVNGCVYE